MPTKLYSAHTAKEIDRWLIKHTATPGIVLMKRAAWFSLATLRQQWPNAQHIHVLCGPGQNAGDGLVLAQYAMLNGYQVSVTLVAHNQPFTGDALLAFQELQACQQPMHSAQHLTIERLNKADVVVDALFGIGLNKAIQGEYAQIITHLNQSKAAVLALDIPSGIHADNGAILGVAVQAEHTCTFITQKLGLHTGAGQAYRGQLHFSGLHLEPSSTPSWPPLAWNHSLTYWLKKWPKRTATEHKGTTGTVCLVGGNQSMMGAIQLAGWACLKTGAGLVKIISKAAHTAAITQAIPELMCTSKHQEQACLASAKAIGLGPGLGQDNWAQARFQAAFASALPKVIDADALHFLKHMPLTALQPNWVLTPHPGEAAALLNQSTQSIQQDRVGSIKALQAKFGGVVVLKGNGTLIYDGHSLEVCCAGNPGMAVGGMGDILTGIISTLLAQGLSLYDAACLGVSLHAHGADNLAAQNGQAGILPSEVAQAVSTLLEWY